MLNENIRNLRKAKHLSQEELSEKLNVVRQTLSKWETGASVPDAEMLLKLSQVLGVSVSELLGETADIKESEETIKELSLRLQAINERLSETTRRRNKNKRIFFTVLLAVFAFLSIINILSTASLFFEGSIINSESIGGADGPTAIYITSDFDPAVFSFIKLIFTLSVSVISVFGLISAKK